MECCLSGVLHQADRLLRGRFGVCDWMPVGACGMKGWNAAVVCTLHESLRDQLPCFFQSGSGGKLKHFGVIEGVFHTNGLTRVRRRGRVGLGHGLRGGGRVDGCRCAHRGRYSCDGRPWHRRAISVMGDTGYRDGGHGYQSDDTRRAQWKLRKGLAEKCCADIRNTLPGRHSLFRGHRRLGRCRSRRCGDRR